MHFARWKFRRVQPVNPTVLMKKHLRPAIWQDSEITAGFKMPEPSEAIFFWESWWSNFAIPHFTPSLKTINSTSRWMDCLIQRRSMYICWLVISSLRYSFCNLADLPVNHLLPDGLPEYSDAAQCSSTPLDLPSLHFPLDLPSSTAWTSISCRRCTLPPQALRASYVLRRHDEKSSWREDKKFIPWSFGPTNFTAPFLYFVCNYPFYSYLFGSIFL